MATAFWAPKETKPEAPHETLYTTLLHPAPIKTLSTSIFCTIWVDSPSTAVWRRRRRSYSKMTEQRWWLFSIPLTAVHGGGGGVAMRWRSNGGGRRRRRFLLAAGNGGVTAGAEKKQFSRINNSYFQGPNKPKTDPCR